VCWRKEHCIKECDEVQRVYMGGVGIWTGLNTISTYCLLLNMKGHSTKLSVARHCDGSLGATRPDSD
jgi:hypothetical protein